MVNNFNNRNFKTFIWTINDVKTYEKIKGLPIDGILTDCPNNFHSEFKFNLDYYLERVGEIIRFCIFILSD